MGCNSSAPKIIATGQSISEEGSLSKQAEVNLQLRRGTEGITRILDDSNEIKVLPTCDTLDSSIQLAVDNKYTDIDAPGIKSDQDNSNITENILNDDKLTKIEEVVHKVVEMYVTPDKQITEVKDERTSVDCSTRKDDQEIYLDQEELQDKNEKSSNENLTAVADNNEENSEIDKQEQFENEILVTRWEALADIAAELPPLLAVDAVTGQIYSLSK